MKKSILFAALMILIASPGVWSQVQPQLPQAGEVAMKTGKMMVKKDGQWVKMDQDVTMKDGTKVFKDGTVITVKGSKKKLVEGEFVSIDGKIKKEKVRIDTTIQKKMEEGKE